MRVDRDTDLQHDKFMVMAPAGVATGSEKEAFKKALIDMWMLDGVVNPEDIVILDRKEKGYSTSELFGMVNSANDKALSANTGFRTMAGSLNYDEAAAAIGILQIDLSPEASSNINQYEVLMNLIVSGDKAAILKLIPGLTDSGRGMLFVYLPRAKAVDLEEEVRNYDRYVTEVLVRA